MIMYKEMNPNRTVRYLPLQLSNTAASKFNMTIRGLIRGASYNISVQRKLPDAEWSEPFIFTIGKLLSGLGSVFITFLTMINWFLIL